MANVNEGAVQTLTGGGYITGWKETAGVFSWIAIPVADVATVAAMAATAVQPGALGTMAAEDAVDYASTSALAAKASQTALDAVTADVTSLESQLAAMEPGAQMLWSLGTPADSVGIDNDFCLDRTNKILYGPKGQPTPGHWTSPGLSLQVSAGATQFKTLAELDAGANAGTLSDTVTYRVTGTDDVAIVLDAVNVPQIVQITSLSGVSRILVNFLNMQKTSPVLPLTWSVTIDPNLGASA